MENVQWRHIAVGLIGLTTLAGISYFAKPKAAKKQEVQRSSSRLQQESGDKNQTPEETPLKDEPAEEVREIYVDIAGEVKKPGVYKLEEDSRMFDLLELSGGLTDKADKELVNRAAKLEDGMKIVIPKFGSRPTKSESATPSKPKSSTKRKKKATSEKLPIVDQEGGTDDQPTSPVIKVNVNTASEEEMVRELGLPPLLSQRIWFYRMEVAEFEKLEDLLQVKGITPSILRKIRPLVTF